MPQPNILFILADDLGWADLGMHGAPVSTPNIDLLAQEGVELTAHYVCPMCTPTRASLLTGRHASRFGPNPTSPTNLPVLPDGYETLATVLQDAGYDTGLFGKWHLGSSPQFGPNHYGFNTAYGSLAGGVDPFNHFYKEGEYSVTWHRNGELLEERGHVTDLIVREAREWIESRTQPWFCYVPFTAVHVPIKPTSEWYARYAGERFDDDPQRDLSYKKYAAYTSHMDHGVGLLLDSLEMKYRQAVKSQRRSWAFVDSSCYVSMGV
jgi:arylsulfatase A-like enzyme